MSLSSGFRMWLVIHYASVHLLLWNATFACKCDVCFVLCGGWKSPAHRGVNFFFIKKPFSDSCTVARFCVPHGGDSKFRREPRFFHNPNLSRIFAIFAIEGLRRSSPNPPHSPLRRLIRQRSPPLRRLIRQRIS